MNSRNAATTRKCPICDASNSNLSLFCAECGASLNGSSTGDTAAYEPLDVDDDAQQTSVYEPTMPASDPTPGNSSSTSTDLGAIPSNWERAPASPVAADRVWSPADQAAQPYLQASAPQGIRGFILGLIAVVLVLAVFLLWGWASILEPDTRDSIQDFFGFIG